ncbi:MAG: hypothetical protein ACTSXA_16045 [Candidatus Heimdallarchaeota archaeon]
MSKKIAKNEKIIVMKSDMLCPHCNKTINSILEIHDKNIPATFHVKMLTTIVYACPECRTVFGASKLYY